MKIVERRWIVPLVVTAVAWFVADFLDQNIFVRKSSVERRRTTTSLPSTAPAPLSIIPATAKRVHLVILVHGYRGCPQAMSYLQTALEQQAAAAVRANGDTDHFIVHSAVSNHGRTTDGIVAAGSRLAAEVNELIGQVVQQTPQANVSLSFVGNSMGGLYGRYALKEIKYLPNNGASVSHAQQGDDTSCAAAETDVHPAVFCTTACPHLGVSQHTYIKLPRSVEYVLASVMRKTGSDLFRFSDVIHQLGTSPDFLGPLARFQKRLAYANTFATDFQVPTSSAAFLTESDSLHRTISGTETNSSVLLTVQTEQRHAELATDSKTASTEELAQRLDALGWTKVFCDVRSGLPSVPLPFGQSHILLEMQQTYSSADLLRTFDSFTDRLHLPFGHPMLIANSMNEFVARLTRAGQPIMDHLAAQLVQSILGQDGRLAQQT
jgi:hypothetical protein